jgi:NDP-sugar pyrophosphorylase family protein
MMTPEEAKAIKRHFPNAKLDCLTRHVNPDFAGKENPCGKVGGWVHKNATVDPTATIHPTSIVMDRACVYDFAILGPNCVIKDDAVVEDFAILENTIVSGFATVSNGSVVLNNSKIMGHTVVEGDSLLDEVTASEYTVITSRELNRCRVRTPLNQAGFDMDEPDPTHFTDREPV